MSRKVAGDLLKLLSALQADHREGNVAGLRELKSLAPHISKALLGKIVHLDINSRLIKIITQVSRKNKPLFVEKTKKLSRYAQFFSKDI